MNRNPLNTPETYALRVLNHPGVLKLTRNSILKNTNEVKISYSDHLIQTTKLIIDKTTIEQAWADFNSHINKLKDRLKVVKNATETKIEYLVFEPSNVDEIFEFFRLRNAFDSSGPDLDEVERYIRECNKNKKLKDWSVLIKGTGDGDLLDIERLNFPFKLKMALRGAPPKGRWRAELETNAIYSPGGGSSNILTGGKDLKYRLSEPEIEKAESEFKDNKFIQLKKENPYLSDEHINKKVDRINIPEKVYRHKMTDKEGILVIYLMDLDKVFKSKEKEIPELAALKERVDTSVPLIGYVIGIPPVRGDIGGVYVQSKYHDKTLELEEFDDFEEMNEVLEL
jgi:hypothetical protein